MIVAGPVGDGRLNRLVMMMMANDDGEDDDFEKPLYSHILSFFPFSHDILFNKELNKKGMRKRLKC